MRRSKSNPSTPFPVFSFVLLSCFMMAVCIAAALPPGDDQSPTVVRPIARIDGYATVDASGNIDLTNASIPDYFHIIGGFQIKNGVCADWYAINLESWYRDSLTFCSKEKVQVTLLDYKVFSGLGVMPMGTDHVLTPDTYNYYNLSRRSDVSIDTLYLSILKYVP